MVSAKRRLLDMRRGRIDGVSAIGNETFSGRGDLLTFFVGEDVLFDLVVGEGDPFDFVGEEGLPFNCPLDLGIRAMMSAISCFFSEVKEVWTSGDLERSNNSSME